MAVSRLEVERRVQRTVVRDDYLEVLTGQGLLIEGLNELLEVVRSVPHGDDHAHKRPHRMSRFRGQARSHHSSRPRMSNATG